MNKDVQLNKADLLVFCDSKCSLLFVYLQNTLYSKFLASKFVKFVSAFAKNTSRAMSIQVMEDWV